jgi:hypothetical protein
MQQTAAEEQSRRMASDMEVRTKQRCHWIPPHRKIAPVDIHQRLLNVCGDQTVDVRQWMVCFSSGISDVRGRPYTAVGSWNEERLYQLIHANQRIMTREPSTLTATSRRWLNWRLEFPESGQRRRQPFSCNTLTPGLKPVWRPWRTLQILAGLAHSISAFHRLLLWPV